MMASISSRSSAPASAMKPTRRRVASGAREIANMHLVGAEFRCMHSRYRKISPDEQQRGSKRASHAFKPHSISLQIQNSILNPISSAIRAGRRDAASRLRPSTHWFLCQLVVREKKLFEPKTHLLAAVGRSGSALCVSLTDRFGVQKIQHREPLVFSQPRPKLRRFDPT